MLLQDVLESSPILKIISLWVLNDRINLRANYFFSTPFAHNILPFSDFLVFSCCVIDFQMSTWMHRNISSFPSYQPHQQPSLAVSLFTKWSLTLDSILQHSLPSYALKLIHFAENRVFYNEIENLLLILKYH